MNEKELKEFWEHEEKIAHIQGWDFSHIKDRYRNSELPWDYEIIVRSYLKNDSFFA